LRSQPSVLLLLAERTILSGLYAKMDLYLWHVRDIRGKATDRVRQVADVTGGIAAFAFVVALIALAVYGSHVLA